MKFKNIQEHFFWGEGRILYFFKNIIAHKNSLQDFNCFNIYFSVLFVFNNNKRTFKNIQYKFTNIQGYSNEIVKFKKNIRDFRLPVSTLYASDLPHSNLATSASRRFTSSLRPRWWSRSSASRSYQRPRWSARYVCWPSSPRSRPTASS